MSAKYRNLSVNEVFEHINDLRGILGTMTHALEEAPHIMGEFSALKAKMGMHGGKRAVSEIYSAVKSAETANEISGEGVKSHVNALMRLSFWYGDKLNPSNYFSAQKNAGQGLNTTSERFRYGPFAALTQEIGQRAGTQFGTYYAKGAAGLRMTGAGLTKAFDYGLLDEKTVQWSNQHKVMPGAQFKAADMAAKDPDLFLFKEVLPALAKAGVDMKNDVAVLRALGQIFTDKNAYGFLFEIYKQKSKMDKDWAGFQGTSGDTAAYREKDPFAAAQGFLAQIQTLALALGNPALEGAVRRLQDINTGLAQIGGDAGRSAEGIKTLEKALIPLGVALGVMVSGRFLGMAGGFAMGANPVTLAMAGIAAGLTAWAELDWNSFTFFWGNVYKGMSVVARAVGLGDGTQKQRAADHMRDAEYFERVNDPTKPRTIKEYADQVERSAKAAVPQVTGTVKAYQSTETSAKAAASAIDDTTSAFGRLINGLKSMLSGDGGASGSGAGGLIHKSSFGGGPVGAGISPGGRFGGLKLGGAGGAGSGETSGLGKGRTASLPPAGLGNGVNRSLSGPYSNELATAIGQSAKDLGVSQRDLATAISYETAGTFDKWKRGPHTKWGQHRGLIQ